mgnify:CR=1 FL=1
MVKGLFRSASGMLVRQTRMDAISNNIANVNTTGYKRDSIFAQRLVEAMPVVGNLRGNHDPHSDTLDMFTDSSTGSFTKTDHPLDVAIQGTGFFVIDTPEGQRLTRNGHFQVDAEGNLVDSNGNAVSGDGGQITLPLNADAYISENGEVVADGEVVGKLQVVEMLDERQMEKLGNGYYASEGVATNPIETTRLVTGSLENSNVDIMMEMVEMISVQREFEVEQKMIHTTDGTLDRLIRDVGRGIG